MVAAVPRRHKDAPPEEELYAPIEWRAEGDYEDVIYERGDSIAKISINRPEVHNAFRPPTLAELRDAFTRARDDIEVATIIFTGAGDQAFCSGGDQRIRGDDGYIGDDEVAEQRQVRLGLGELGRIVEVDGRPLRREHACPLGFGESRAERQRNGTELHQGMQQHDLLAPRVHGERRDRIPPHPVGGQPASDPSRLRLQLGVGDAGSFRDQRRPLRATMSTLREPVVELHP